MANLNVKINHLHLKNPVMTASGTFGYGLEFADFVPLDGIGGIIVKGTTLHAREGNDYPRMVETPKGMQLRGTAEQRRRLFLRPHLPIGQGH